VITVRVVGGTTLRGRFQPFRNLRVGLGSDW
jgi:hypothetical protein